GMTLISLHDKATIETFLRRNAQLHLYELGDLDQFFWPYTNWYALAEGGQIHELALLYSAFDPPVLLFHAQNGRGQAMLQALMPVLPRRVYSHLDALLVDTLAAAYAVEPHGDYQKMGLVDQARLHAIGGPHAEQLGPDDRAALEALYAAAYPGNWFSARMLETGCYYGIRDGGAIVSVAGVHVVAPEYGVAALGNVTTHPAMRGRGLGTAVCAALCRALLAQQIGTIGLNVRASNEPAIATYRRLGFEYVANYSEFMLVARPL
ncbi:MAG TPA: GNAT family N-acetyltransferase, partial [Roseiflexaceae bacterium]|nr:GNAT family N-acetyltransferase [Roseiflexaceae bacterium]